jgi:hypothetical protein
MIAELDSNIPRVIQSIYELAGRHLEELKRDPLGEELLRKLLQKCTYAQRKELEGGTMVERPQCECADCRWMIIRRKTVTKNPKESTLRRRYPAVFRGSIRRRLSTRGNIKNLLAKERIERRRILKLKLHTWPSPPSKPQSPIAVIKEESILPPMAPDNPPANKPTTFTVPSSSARSPSSPRKRLTRTIERQTVTRRSPQPSKKTLEQTGMA